MNLLEFSQQTTPPARRRWPIVIIYPADAPIAVPEHWRRLPDGRIEATYNTYDELYWSVTISVEIVKISVTQPAETKQSEMFPRENRGGGSLCPMTDPVIRPIGTP
jgi:hypothetical protein